MNVFITSSPYVQGADRAFLNPENDFIDRMRDCLPPYPTALFVASDPERHDLTCQFGADTAIAYAAAGMPFSRYFILDRSNASQAAELVSQSDLVILAGGHVPTQNAFFQRIGLREVLQGYQGTIMGISAGSMNLADTVYVQPEEPGEGTDPNFDRFAPGLGLTDVNILPHYQKVKHDILDGLRLFEDITYPDSNGNLFFALVDGSYFYQNEHQLLLYGESYVVRDGGILPLIGSGDCMDMAYFE